MVSSHRVKPVLWLLCLLVVAAGQALALESVLFVDGDQVRLRSAPGLEGSQVIGSLNRGEELRVKSQDGQWRKVWVPRLRQTGWVAHWMLAEVPPPGFRREVAYANADQLVIRTGPGQSYGQKGVLAKGTTVDVIAYADQWRKIRVPQNGEWGWVAGWLLTGGSGSGGREGASSGDKPGYFGQSRWITASDVNLRSNPSTGQEPLATLRKGTRVYLMQLGEKWAKVRVHGGPVGWCSREFLSDNPPAGVTATVAAQGDDSSWGDARWVGVGELYLRPGPDSDNRPMATLLRGQKVYLMYLQEDWAQVHVHNGDIGWVFRDYLKENPIADAIGGVVDYTEDASDASQYDAQLSSLAASLGDHQAVVTKPGCNLRSGPGTMFAQVGVVGTRDVLTVHGQASGWLKVSTAQGTKAWILAAFCETQSDPKTLPASEVPQPPSVAVTAGAGDPQGIGKRIAELCLGQVGKPYIWGAESPSSGFDCSGLVYWSHGQMGISMMRTTYDMWDDPRGKAVSGENLQPGDVVCFANTYRRGVSHVGVYIGDGMFVHAPGRGQAVRTERLSNRSRSFCGARRFY